MDEREGKPSASVAEQMFLCPGSWALTRGMPELATPNMEAYAAIMEPVAGPVEDFRGLYPKSHGTNITGVRRNRYLPRYRFGRSSFRYPALVPASAAAARYNQKEILIPQFRSRTNP